MSCTDLWRRSGASSEERRERTCTRGSAFVWHSARAALVVVTAVDSAMAALAWPLMRTQASNMSADARARLLFRLRILPPALAVVFVFALVVPAYVLLEAPHTAEDVGLKRPL